MGDMKVYSNILTVSFSFCTVIVFIKLAKDHKPRPVPIWVCECHFGLVIQIWVQANTAKHLPNPENIRIIPTNALLSCSGELVLHRNVCFKATHHPGGLMYPSQD